MWKLLKNNHKIFFPIIYIGLEAKKIEKKLKKSFLNARSG